MYANQQGTEMITFQMFLGLVLSNEEHIVEKINYLPSLGSSDHVLLDFDFNCFINVNKSAF